MQGCFIGNKVINLFRYINHNSNGAQQKNSKEESDEKFFDDISVECFQYFCFYRTRIIQILQIHTDYKICKNPLNLRHLCSIFILRS